MQRISKVAAAVACTLTLSTIAASTAVVAQQADNNVVKPSAAAAKVARYVVTYKDNAHNLTSKTGQSVFNATAASQSLKSRGANIKLEITSQRAIAAELSPRAVKALRKDPRVQNIELDASRHLMSLYDNTPGNPNQVQVTPYAIIQSQANQLALQSGKKVCVIDSGLDASNPDFNWSGITGDNDSGTGSWNLNGGAHGTHVAGTVGAADNGVGVVGMAPGVDMHIIKVFNASGWGYSSDLAHAAQKCTDAGADIITMSLGGGGANSTERNAFETFTANGGLVLAAAGNDGDATRSYPAGYKSVMMIGANDSDNNIADFSQHPTCTNGDTDDGYCVEVTAGGVNTLSAYPSQDALDQAGAGSEGTGWSSGTTDGVDMNVTGMENLGSVSGATYFMGTAEATDSGANGKICIIDRGNISFHDKVQNCENSGGTGAVIVNNVAGIFSGTLGETNATTIPTLAGALEDRAAWMDASSVSIDIIPSMYGLMSGTSMATPGVAGVAALVWSNHDTCTGTEIRNALKATAEDAGTTGKDDYFGYGIVKAKAASDYITQFGCEGDTTTPPPPPPPPPSGGELTQGVAETFSGASASETLWFYNTPADVETVSFNMVGGSGDADLFVKFGSAPTSTSYDCRPFSAGSTEACDFPAGQEGTYHIMVRGYSAYTDVSLTADHTTGGTPPPPPPPPGEGDSGGESDINVDIAEWKRWEVEIPAGATNFVVTTSGGSGDGDLYVQQGSAPTSSSYDCRPFDYGNDEICTIAAPAAGTMHIAIYGYSIASGVTMNWSYE